MVDFKVEHFSSTIKNDGKGRPSIYILCKLVNRAGNPSLREYRIWKDENFPNLAQLEQAIADGFNEAKLSGDWVEITVFAERFYLTFVLPSSTSRMTYRVSGLVCYTLRSQVLKHTGS
ncbi:hypothetical protein RYB67_09270 [Pseudomonas syringae]|nr:hypothetical protein [Pseudomonas syringae]